MAMKIRRQDYNQARCDCEAKKAIFKAKMMRGRGSARTWRERENDKGNLFRVAKQMVNRNRDVVGANCKKNSDGKIVLEEDRLMEVWRAHYDVLSNEEFSWDREGLTDVSPVCGPSERISVFKVDAAIGEMKQGKPGGTTGVVSETLKAAGETGTLWMTDVCNAVVEDGKIPEDWSRSWMVNVYKGKGGALACGPYRSIRLLEHAMKVLERVIEGRVRKIVKIDSMQFGFMVGRGRPMMFLVCQLQDKYLANNKELWMAFVDLQKAFNRVPREMVWWALRYFGVDKWIVLVIRAMYENATIKVQLN